MTDAEVVTLLRRPGGDSDEIVLLDSTPVECGRSVETARRSELAGACGHGYCRSHSRWFWGMRLHLCCAPDGRTPPGPHPQRAARTRIASKLLALAAGVWLNHLLGQPSRAFAAQPTTRNQPSRRRERR